jgi:hypothetical protein
MGFDIGRALSGVGTGAGAGATIGSFFSPVGTAIGAGVGGLAGFLGSLFGGRGRQRRSMIQDQGINQQMMNLPGDIGQVQRQQIPEGTLLNFPMFSPEQMQQQQQLGRFAQGQLPGLFGPPQGMAQSGAQEAQALRDFREQTIPGIAEQFTGPATPGQRSSAFRQSLGRAGAGLEERLALIREDRDRFNLQRLDQRAALQANLLPSLLGFGQRQQFDQQLIPRDPGLMAAAAPGLAQGVGQGIPFVMEAGARALFNRLFRSSATGAGGGTQAGGTGTGGTGA